MFLTQPPLRVEPDARKQATLGAIIIIVIITVGRRRGREGRGGGERPLYLKPHPVG